MTAPLVILLALAAALVWILAGGAGSAGRRRSADVDEEELAQAEDELRQLDAGTTPEEAEEELDDWGPGAPK
jgi:hypothetical protein